jgi:hypothetical protein
VGIAVVAVAVGGTAVDIAVLCGVDVAEAVLVDVGGTDVLVAVGVTAVLVAVAGVVVFVAVAGTDVVVGVLVDGVPVLMKRFRMLAVVC